MPHKLTDRDAREAGTKLRRVLDQRDVTCPAGTELGGKAVYCGVEEHVIDVDHEAESLRVFCCGSYVSCPTWIRERERLAAKRTKALIAE